MARVVSCKHGSFRLFTVLSLVGIAMAAGCNDSAFEFAPVSGVVMMDGEPLEGASVLFQPRASGEELRSGPSAMGVTDSKGRFKLATRDVGVGAVVGKHRVRISTLRFEPSGASDFKMIAPEKVPARYNTRSELSHDVPPEGLSDYRFELESK